MAEVGREGYICGGYFEIAKVMEVDFEGYCVEG